MKTSINCVVDLVVLAFWCCASCPCIVYLLHVAGIFASVSVDELFLCCNSPLIQKAVDVATSPWKIANIVCQQKFVNFAKHLVLHVSLPWVINVASWPLPKRLALTKGAAVEVPQLCAAPCAATFPHVQLLTLWVDLSPDDWHCTAPHAAMFPCIWSSKLQVNGGAAVLHCHPWCVQWCGLSWNVTPPVATAMSTHFGWLFYFSKQFVWCII